MRMTVRFVIILICLCNALFAAARVSADDILDLRHENELLESELALARKAQVYFIFNLKDKNIYLKTRGASMRELPINQVRGWNLPASVKPHPLVKKSSKFKPRREEIYPGGKETATTDTFEIDALELADMPSRYNLILDDNVVITVQPKPGGILSYLENSGYSLGWYISRPLLTLWGALAKRPHSYLYISMEKTDAQSLYWSFYEGSQCIIYNP